MLVSELNPGAWLQPKIDYSQSRRNRNLLLEKIFRKYLKPAIKVKILVHLVNITPYSQCHCYPSADTTQESVSSSTKVSSQSSKSPTASRSGLDKEARTESSSKAAPSSVSRAHQDISDDKSVTPGGEKAPQASQEHIPGPPEGVPQRHSPPEKPPRASDSGQYYGA